MMKQGALDLCGEKATDRGSGRPRAHYRQITRRRGISNEMSASVRRHFAVRGSGRMQSTVMVGLFLKVQVLKRPDFSDPDDPAGKLAVHYMNQGRLA